MSDTSRLGFVHRAIRANVLMQGRANRRKVFGFDEPATAVTACAIPADQDHDVSDPALVGVKVLASLPARGAGWPLCAEVPYARPPRLALCLETVYKSVINVIHQPLAVRRNLTRGKVDSLKWRRWNAIAVIV